MQNIKKIIDETGKGLNKKEEELIEKAYNFAQKAHEGQKRETGDPYFTHVYETAKMLLGDDFQKKYYVTSINIQMTNKLKNKVFIEAKNVFNDILYPIKGKKKGVIITIYSNDKLGYMVIGKDKKETLKIEKDFLKRI